MISQTLIEEDRPLMEEYAQFSSLIKDCAGVTEFNEEDEDTKSKWIIRFELDRESMLDKNINMDDVHFALEHSFKDEISCIYSDFNADKLVLRVRLDKDLINSKKKSLDQSDEIYKLKNLQQNLLDNIILRGIKKIPKVLLRKLVNRLKLVDSNYEKKDIWVLDTVGTNFHDILTLNNILANKTYSNDIQEVYRTLGIEAARECVFTESLWKHLKKPHILTIITYRFFVIESVLLRRWYLSLDMVLIMMISVQLLKLVLKKPLRCS